MKHKLCKFIAINLIAYAMSCNIASAHSNIANYFNGDIDGVTNANIRIIHRGQDAVLVLYVDQILKNSKTLNIIGMEQLYRIANLLQEPGMKKFALKINSYTDKIGSSLDKVLRSNNAAHAIATYLITAGINPRRIVKINGKENKSIVKNINSDIIQGIFNRRVEIVLLNFDK